MDRFLASGWFRTVNMLFRAKVTCFDNDICSPINIRVRLTDHVFSKSLRKLYNRNGRLFWHEIRKATITPEKEALFRQHQRRFRSFLCNSLEEFLVLTPRFDTYEINIYDEDRLVAVSYFDQGENSVMSLLGLFETGYASYSLGIYSMLLEMEYAKSRNQKWYYPGYVHESPSMYDYKLRFGPVEVYDWQSRRWLKNISPHLLPNMADHIRKKTTQLENRLTNAGVGLSKKVYLFFGWHYFNSMYEQLYRCPLPLILNDGRVVALDPDTDQFICIKWEIYVPFRDIQMTLAPDFDVSKHHTDVMRVTEIQYQTSRVTDIVRFVKETTPPMPPIVSRIFGKVVG
ncbi:MAG: arginyl-tRNA--protein transferase [Spirosomaceae bacterium]|nr:arginyl-tRNA--protein transferase [Spirosomataceae bacterium]